MTDEARRVAIMEWCNGVIPYTWDRLPLNEGKRDTPPSLQEDWFVDDALACGSPFVWRSLSPENSHRALYRYARMKAWERGEYDGNPEWMMLHQMVILTTMLYFAVFAVGGAHHPTGD